MQSGRIDSTRSPAERHGYSLVDHDLREFPQPVLRTGHRGNADERRINQQIFREALGIALDRLQQHFGGYAVEFGELSIQEHFVAAQDEDGVGDVLDGFLLQEMTVSVLMVPWSGR